MPELNLSPVASVLAGFGALAVAWRVLWPVLKTMLENTTTRGRVERDLLEITSEERDKAIARAESAEKRADSYFSEMADMRSQVQLLTYQLKLSTEQIERLTEQLSNAQTQLSKAQQQIEDLSAKLNRIRQE